MADHAVAAVNGAREIDAIVLDWPVVALPDGSLVNPIGKAFKRVENGPADSLPYVHSVLVERRAE